MTFYTLVWLVVLLPAIGALVSFLAEAPRRAAQTCTFFTGLGVLAALALLTYRLAHRGDNAFESLVTFWTLQGSSAGPSGGAFPDDFHPQIGLRVDALSASLLTAFGFAAWLVQRHAVVSLRGDAGHRRAFWVMAATTSAVSMAVAGAGLFTFLFASILAGVGVWLLAGHRWGDAGVADAARRAFTILRTGDLLLLFGAVLVIAKFGHDASSHPPPAGQDLSDPLAFAVLDHEAIAARAGLVAGVGIRTLVVVSLLLLVAVMMRSAQFPFHSWLTDATSTAPLPVPALIVASAAGGGIVLIARGYRLFLEAPHLLTLVAALGAGTALVAAAQALVERDIVRLAVRASVAQLGVILVTLGAGGYSAGMYVLLTYTLLTTLIFLCATNLTRAYRSRDITDMGGAWPRMRWTGAALMLWVAGAAGADFAGYSAISTLLRNTHPAGGQMGAVPRALILLALACALVLRGVAAIRLALVVVAGGPSPRRGFQVERVAEAEPRLRRAAVLAGAGAILTVLIGLPMTAPYTFSHFVFYGQHRQDLSLIPGALALAALVTITSVFAGWALYSPARRPRSEPLRTRIAATIARTQPDSTLAAVARLPGRMFTGLGRLVTDVDRAIVGPLNDALGDAIEASQAIAPSPAVPTRRSLTAVAVAIAVLAGVVVLATATGHLPVPPR